MEIKNGQWYYKELIYDKLHNEEYYGFIYIITVLPKKDIPEDMWYKKYLGKKNFFFTKSIKKGKRELALMTDKRGSKKKVIKTESDWKTYKSSNEFLKQQQDKDLHKEIIMFCKSKGDLTYYETKLQFQCEVLESDKWINGNILSKFFNRY